MSGLVTDEKERKMDPIHIRDVGGGGQGGGEIVCYESVVSQSLTQTNTSVIAAPNQAPIPMMRQSKDYRQVEKVIITRATSE
jgi:hypothetical protein